jgi:hypothetical protein
VPALRQQLRQIQRRGSVRLDGNLHTRHGGLPAW